MQFNPGESPMTFWFFLSILNLQFSICNLQFRFFTLPYFTLPVVLNCTFLRMLIWYMVNPIKINPSIHASAVA